MIIEQQGITKQVTLGAFEAGLDVLTSTSATALFATSAFSDIVTSGGTISASVKNQSVGVLGDSSNIATSVNGGNVIVKYVGVAGQAPFSTVSADNAKVSASTGNTALGLHGDGTYITTSASGASVKFEFHVNDLLTSASADSRYLTSASAASSYLSQGSATAYLTSASAESRFASRAFTQVSASNNKVSASVVDQTLNLRGDGNYVQTSASGGTIVTKFSGDLSAQPGLVPNGVGVCAGSNYTLATSPSFSTLHDGQVIAVFFDNTNVSTSVTLNVNSTGNQPILDCFGFNLTPKAIVPEKTYLMVYTSAILTGWNILDPVNPAFANTTNSGSDYTLVSTNPGFSQPQPGVPFLTTFNAANASTSATLNAPDSSLGALVIKDQDNITLPVNSIVAGRGYITILNGTSSGYYYTLLDLPKYAFSSVAASNATVSASSTHQKLTLIGDNSNISTSASGSTIKIKYVAAAGAIGLTTLSASNAAVSVSSGNTNIALRGDGTFISTSASGATIKFELIGTSAFATQAFSSVAADAGAVSASSTRQGLLLKGDGTYISTSASGASVKFEFTAVSTFMRQGYSSVAASNAACSASTTRDGLKIYGDGSFITTSASGNTITIKEISPGFATVSGGAATTSASAGNRTLSIRGDTIYTSVSVSGASVTVKRVRPAMITVSTAREVSAADEGAYIRSDGTSAFTIFLPTCASVNLPVGFNTLIRQSGTGQITITARSGASVQVPASCSAQSRAQGATLTLIKVGQDTWDLGGDLSTF
jgi:hypothetical protein